MASSFFSQDCVDYFVFCGPIQVWWLFCFSVSLKEFIGILIGIALNLYIVLGNMDLLTMLILSIHERGLSFHFIVCFSIFLHYAFQCSVYKSFTTFVQLILFAIAKENLFLTSFSEISLLVYPVDFFKRFYLFFLERGKEGEKEGEKHQHVVASHVPPSEYLVSNPGMCPD